MLKITRGKSSNKKIQHILDFLKKEQKFKKKSEKIHYMGKSIYKMKKKKGIAHRKILEST